jgi:hypothetical protein
MPDRPSYRTLVKHGECPPLTAAPRPGGETPGTNSRDATMSAIKPGDYVDVRMVAVGLNSRGDVIVRHPESHAVHQFVVEAHRVQG